MQVKSFLINVSVLLVTLLLFSVVVEFFSRFSSEGCDNIRRAGSSDTFDSIAGWTDYKNSMYRVRTTEYDNVIRVNSEDLTMMNGFFRRGMKLVSLHWVILYSGCWCEERSSIY